MRLSVNLLGGSEVSLDSGAPWPLRAKKARALLAYLALAAGRACPRDALASLLWGASGDVQARKSLRQAVYVLRTAWGDPGNALLLSEGEGVLLNPAAVEVDVLQFEQLVREGTPEALDRAATLYGGDLLHGFVVGEAGFEEWLVAERERLRALAVAALGRLLAHQVTTRATEEGIQTAARLLALDPLRESAHRTLMHLYARQGRRAAALRQYQLCADLLRREVRTEPEAATRELYRALLQADHGARISQDIVSPPSEPVRRSPPRPTRPELPVPEVPLIGRDRELAELRELSRLARRGQGQVAIVRGEAGIGKSRLLAEVAREVIGTGGDVLLGRAFESERWLGFGPWVAALRASAALATPAVRDALAPVWRAELARLFPEIGEEVAPGGADQRDDRRLFEAMEHLLGSLAARRPTLLILEDLHWADDPSLRLLSYIGRRSGAWPLLVMGSVREEELAEATTLRRIAGELAESGRCHEIRLAPLTREATAALVRSLIGGGDQVSAALDEQVWQASGGNPFITVEMIRMLERDGEGRPPSAVPAPASVRKLITNRLERLSDRAQQVAGVAAVIGRAFEFRLLERASGLSGRETAQAVEELVARRVLDCAGGTLDFTHDRIREVVHERLLVPTRQVLHRDVAWALEAMSRAPVAAGAEPAETDRGDELFASLAWHYRQAEEWPKAAHYLMKAAETARRRYAYHEASRLCRDAIDVLDHHGSPAAETVRALELFGDLRSLLAQPGPANEAYDRAVRMSDDAASRQRIADKYHRPSTAVRDGARIACYQHGRGHPTLFLTHPVFYGQGTYQPLVDLLCHEFRIITSDPRGAGGSDPLPDVYGLRDHVEDVRAVIEAAGGRPIVFVGMSRAAALGVVLATTHAPLVERLVLIGTPPAAASIDDVPGIDQEFWQRIVALIQAGDYERAMPLFWAREFSEPGSQELVNTFVQLSLAMPRDVLRIFFTVHDPGRDIRQGLRAPPRPECARAGRRRPAGVPASGRRRPRARRGLTGREPSSTLAPRSRSADPGGSPCRRKTSSPRSTRRTCGPASSTSASGSRPASRGRTTSGAWRSTARRRCVRPASR